MGEDTSSTMRLNAMVPALFAGALGLAPLGLQPVLVSAAAGTRVEPAVLSGCELAAVAVTCAILVARPLPTMLYGLLMAMGHGLALYHPELALLGRIAAGFGEGGLCAVAIRSLLCAVNPIRAASLFTGLSAIPQIVGWLAQLRSPGPASASSFLILTGLLAMLIAYAISGGALPPICRDRADRQSLIRLVAMIALVATLNFLGNLIWVNLSGWVTRYSGVRGSHATELLFACMLGQVFTTFAMARFAPERRIAGWLILSCVIETLGVFGLSAAPTGIVFLAAGILATAAWQATLPLATGLYLAVGGRNYIQLVLPVSLGGMALGAALSDDFGPQRVVGCLALVIMALSIGLLSAGRSRFRGQSSGSLTA